MEELNLFSSEIAPYLFDKNPSPMVIFDRDSLQIIKVNEAACAQYGYSREEFRDLDLTQIRPKEDIPILIEDLQKTDPVDRKSVYRHLTKDGEIFYAKIRSQKMTVNGRSLQLAVIDDVTSEIEAKIQAQQAEELARLGWWRYEIRENRLIWSDKLYDIMDVDKETYDATFEAFYDLIYPEDRPKMDKVLKQIRETNEPMDYVIRGIRQDEEISYLKCRAQGEFNDDGKLLRLNGVTLDTTEEVRAQQKLQKRSKAIASSMDGIAILNANGEFVFMNQAHADIYGYDSPDELLGNTWEVLYRDKDLPFFSEHVLPQIGQEGQWKGEAEGKRKDGSLFPQEVSLSRTQDSGLICIVRDITQQKEHEQKIQESLEEKEVLLQEIHHRVKNNLSVISGLLELQRFEPLESIDSLIDETQSRIKSIATIHEKLYQSDTLAEVDIKEYIEDFTEIVWDTFNSEQKDITISKDLQHFSIDITKAVPLGLIINELLTNAFKHGFPDIRKGEIRIILKKDPQEVLLSVEDNGHPLPDDFSLENSNSLGMTLIKTLSSQLDGTIDISQDEWTTFKITFPASISH
jgi:PAS domain S-box-containing protein